jgi:hypothetical protein
MQIYLNSIKYFVFNFDFIIDECTDCASEGALSRLVPSRRPVVKINAESLSQHDEKHVVPTLLSVRKG